MKIAVSSIISVAQQRIIENWTGKKFGNLLWRASEHGFGLDQFKLRCFNKVNQFSISLNIN